MKISTNFMLKVLLILSWIIFIGVSIEAGGFIVNAIIPLVKPEAAGKLWKQADLTALLQYDRGQFIVQMSIIIIVAIARATLFYMFIKLLHDKKFDIEKPFNIHVVRFIQLSSYLAFLIGFFSNYGKQHASWMIENGVKMPDLEQMRLGGADVWLFMGVALLVIAQIFKRGIEIQTENELTV
ncbi:MAG: hypothetical protein DI535_06785 [Citrobacter freundii]|nr:MAG: hypothetical protein DI535_06785 [Citrobacter freundii]